MSEWVKYRLSEIFPISMSGEWGGEPIEGGNSLVLRAADFTKDCKLRAEIGVARQIPNEKLGVRILRDGDLLVEKSGGSIDQPVGRVAFFDRANHDEIYTHSNFLQLLRVEEGFSKKFAYYLMAFLYESGLVYRYQQQTTGIFNLKLEHYLNETVSVPASQPIRKRIQLILSLLDQAIEKTEALIEKYGQIKAGMMHDLFTRGLTADGKLRPPRDQAPELYKETPIGWIPKEWEWGALENYCLRICVGIVIRPADYYVAEGIPTFRSANVRESGITDNDLVYISAKSNAMLHKSQVRTGDILTVRTGYPGTSAVVPEKYDGCNCVDILISTPMGSILSEFLCYWINSSFGKGQVLSGQGGLAQQHFNVGEMRELLVIRPGKDEQGEITKRLDAVEAKIETQQEFLEKYKIQKSGLMHDLLTGKVPVKLDKPEVAHV